MGMTDSSQQNTELKALKAGFLLFISWKGKYPEHLHYKYR